MKFRLVVNVRKINDLMMRTALRLAKLEHQFHYKRTGHHYARLGTISGCDNLPTKQDSQNGVVGSNKGVQGVRREEELMWNAPGYLVDMIKSHVCLICTQLG